MSDPHHLRFQRIGNRFTALALLIAVSLVGDSPAADPPAETDAATLGRLSPLAELQSMLKLPLRVVDSEGNPVPGAKVTP